MNLTNLSEIDLTNFINPNQIVSNITNITKKTFIFVGGNRTLDMLIWCSLFMLFSFITYKIVKKIIEEEKKNGKTKDKSTESIGLGEETTND